MTHPDYVELIQQVLTQERRIANLERLVEILDGRADRADEKHEYLYDQFVDHIYDHTNRMEG